MIVHMILGPDNRVLGVAHSQHDFTTSIEMSESVYNEITNNGYDGYFVENGMLVKKMSYLNLLSQQRNVDAFRSWRSQRLAKYDLIRLCALNGDIDPATNQPYPAITEAEKQWRVEVLNFTDQITHETTEADYPEPPERLR